MSSSQTISELCAICDAQNRIIKAQSEALAQLGAAVMEEEKTEIRDRYDRFFGKGEL